MTHTYPCAAGIPAPTDGLRVGNKQHWGHGWRVSRGNWVPARFSPGDTVSGFANAYGRRLAALYADDGEPWLQFGESVESWCARALPDWSAGWSHGPERAD